MDKDFSYQFSTSKRAKEIFPHLLDVRYWWNGLMDEKITGESRNIGDVFTFSAGNGVHFSEQKLIEIKQDEKIVWLVTKCNLSFLRNKDEWENTKIQFDLNKADSVTTITFKHKGLFPEIECYQSCSNAWNQYFNKLEKLLQ